jgi:hypothetical protein
MIFHSQKRRRCCALPPRSKTWRQYLSLYLRPSPNLRRCLFCRIPARLAAQPLLFIARRPVSLNNPPATHDVQTLDPRLRNGIPGGNNSRLGAEGLELARLQVCGRPAGILHISSVTVGSRGTIWVNHLNSPLISSLDGYEIKTLPSPGIGANRFYESPGGQLWTIATNGLQLFANNRWLQYPVPEISAEFRNNNLSLFRPVHYARCGRTVSCSSRRTPCGN